MRKALRLTFITLLLAVSSLSAATFYVSLGSTNPTPPYTNWVTAATSIQQAVGAAAAGDEVVVTNGIYPGGVAVTKLLTLLSANGPQVTVINGGGPCVSLTDGASLTGFTLTNGGASGGNGGGVWCASTNAFLTNCVIVGNMVQPSVAGGSTGWGGGVYGGTLYQCTLRGNQAVTRWVSSPQPPYQTPIYGYGGGAYGSVLHVCTVGDNSAESGSGVYESTLYNCTLDGNSGGDAYGLGGGACWSSLYDCTLTHNTNTYGGGACYGTLSNCVMMANYGNTGGGAAGATLYNCTLTANSAGPQSGWVDGEGGGAWGAKLYNCTLTGNSVNEDGGGVYGGTLYNCILTSNSAALYGGGAASGELYSCTLTGNSAGYRGGGASSTLYNCITYFNTAAAGFNYDTATTLSYCCTTPLPPTGNGNITNAPLFVDYANNNLRLQANSPCINAGTNDYVTTTIDLDGRPRIVGGTVDIGAYEFQGQGMGEFIGWLQQYALPTDGSADFIDSDDDGMNNWQEWVCGTCPTNAQSVLRLVSATPAGTNITVTWQSVAGVNYFLQRSTNLASPFMLLATNIVGQTGTTSYGDTNAAGKGPFFYRVGVKSP